MAGNSGLLIVLSVLAMLYYYSEAQLFSSTLLLEKTSHCPPPISEKLTIFEPGNYTVSNPISVYDFGCDLALEPLLILSPTEAGLYPVLFFIIGTYLSNTDYSQLLTHIASHGYIVVAAPRLYPTFDQFILFDQTEEIEMAATAINWFPSNLQNVLNNEVSDQVTADLNRLAISGHSRGGKSAFALALGIPKTIKLSLKISALIGVDPVAGLKLPFIDIIRTTPYVLTYQNNSFDLSIPVTVIGTGLGSYGTIPCAPLTVNHQEFFNECNDGSHFVIEEYGHLQMLDDDLSIVDYYASLSCVGGIGSKDVMRRTLGGIMVAFLDAFMKDDIGQYCTLLDNPRLAPTDVSVETKGNHFGFAPTDVSAQV